MDLDDLFLEPTGAGARAGGKFKPKTKPRPNKKASISIAAELPDDAKENPSTQHSFCEGEETVDASTESANLSNALLFETAAPDNGTINESTYGAISEENVEIFSEGIHSSMEASTLHAWTDVDMEKRMDDDMNAPAFPDDTEAQDDSVMFKDFIDPELDGDIHDHNGGMQTEEAEDCLDMETLDIVQEGTTSYGQHSGKFQPKPKCQDDVNQSVNEYIDYVSLGTGSSEFMVNGQVRNEAADMDDHTVYGDLQDVCLPQMHEEPASEMGNGTRSNGWNHEELFEEQSGKDRDMGKSKRAEASQDDNEASEEQSCEKPHKKFKHSTRRRRRRTLAKELLETPDDEIRFLPISDMLQLVDYKEWLEKKEAKEAGALPTKERDETESHELVLNYHSYMQRPARLRWSKQDTERFYEGIREFGTDLSMIQQLFPDRTREQVKLKYKLEERRQPVKLNDALASRAKNHFHYHNVIKNLQEAAAQATRVADEEDEGTIGNSPNMEADTTDVPYSEEPAKSEASERMSDVDVQGVRSDGGGDREGDDVKSDGGDADDDAYWNSYQSEI